MRPTLEDEWDLEPWDDDPDGVDAHYIRESSEPGIDEVGVDLPQSGEFKSVAQFADREGIERDPVFVWLNLVAVLEDEHQMSDVLVAEAIRHLPGIEHHASPPPASHHLVGHLNDPALCMELLPVTGVNHHIAPGTGHPPQPRQRLNHRVAAGGVDQRVPDAEHHVKPFAGGRGKIRPPTAQQRDGQLLSRKPGRRTPGHRVAAVGRPHGEAPAREHRRVDAPCRRPHPARRSCG
jgi:hypothetical protein